MNAKPKLGLIAVAKKYLAFKRLKQLFGVDLFANKCMPEMSALPYGYGYAGCLDTFLNHTTGHHYSIVLGDSGDELKYLAEILGIHFVLDE